MRVIIFLRGRNTDYIIGDAEEDGLVDDREIIIACHDKANDRLARKTDIEIDDLDLRDHDDVILIANGGGTAAQVKATIKVVMSGKPARIIDLQMDGTVELYLYDPSRNVSCYDGGTNQGGNAGDRNQGHDCGNQFCDNYPHPVRNKGNQNRG
jgi:hypothetical protein